MKKILFLLVILFSFNFLYSEEEGVRHCLYLDLSPTVKYLGSAVGVGLSYEISFGYFLSAEVSFGYSYMFEVNQTNYGLYNPPCHLLSPMLILKYYFAGTGPTQSYVMIGVREYSRFYINTNDKSISTNVNAISPGMGAGFKWMAGDRYGFNIEPYVFVGILLQPNSQLSGDFGLGLKLGWLI